MQTNFKNPSSRKPQFEERLISTKPQKDMQTNFKNFPSSSNPNVVEIKPPYQSYAQRENIYNKSRPSICFDVFNSCINRMNVLTRNIFNWTKGKLILTQTYLGKDHQLVFP